MKDFLLLLALNELIIMGVNLSTMEDMVFGDAAKWMDKHWPEWITKPLYECTFCCASIWGSAVYWSVMPWTQHSALWFVWYEIALVGMGAIGVRILPSQSPAE